MTAAIGDRVQLVRPLPYLKTADPMPMLRFRRGTFLIPLEYLRVLDATSD